MIHTTIPRPLPQLLLLLSLCCAAALATCTSSPSCSSGVISSVRDGAWEDKTTWSPEEVPGNDACVSVEHTVVLNTDNVQLKSLVVKQGAVLA